MMMVADSAPTRTGLADLSVSYSHANYKTTQPSRKSLLHFAVRYFIGAREEPKNGIREFMNAICRGNHQVQNEATAAGVICTHLFAVYPCLNVGTFLAPLGSKSER